MKVIFLDFNGVLDNSYDFDLIDKENLDILKGILNQTKAKVVITSSVKNSYYINNGQHNNIMLYFLEEFKKNNIDFYGMTEYNGLGREKEIKDYLEKHQEIEAYYIIDDDYYFESMKEHMIKLVPQYNGGNGLKDLPKDLIKSIR